jgi:hypothetical protein
MAIQTFSEWLIENHPEAIDEGVLDWLGKQKGKVGKALLPIALATGIGGGMAPKDASAAIRQVTPSREAPAGNIQQIRVSKANSLQNLFRPDPTNFPDGTIVPAKGNGVLVKSVASIASDELADDVNDFSVYNQKTPAKSTTAKATGRGLNAEDAIKDALRQAGGQALGTGIDAQTVVQDDEIVRDTIVSRGIAVVHSFKILNAQQKGGIIEVTV